MPQERADLVGGFRRKNMLELAGLLLNLGLAVQRQAISKKPLGETMAANHVRCALPASWREFHDQASFAG